MNNPKTVQVVRIMHRLSISGPTHHAAYLTRFLPSRFQTLLVSGMLAQGEVDGRFIIDEFGIQPHYIASMKRSINPFQDFAALLEIYRLLRKVKPQIVHTHAAKSGTLGRLAAIMAGVPIILHTFHGHTFHSYFHPVINGVFLRIERFLAKRSTRIIAISAIQKKELTERFRICSPEKMEVIPLGFDLRKFAEQTAEKRAQFRQRWQLAEGEMAIGIIGRLTKIKNQHMFLRVMAELKATGTKGIRGVLVGDGELMGPLQEEAKKLGLSFCTPDQIRGETDLIFTSWQEEMDLVMQGLDIVTLTSFNEGTPVTLIEALSAGKPVVSTNVGGIADIVEHGKNGYLTAVDDVPAFTEALLRILRKDSETLPFAACAETIRNRYTLTRLVADMENLYNRLLKEKGLA